MMAVLVPLLAWCTSVRGWWDSDHVQLALQETTTGCARDETAWICRQLDASRAIPEEAEPEIKTLLESYPLCRPICSSPWPPT